MKKLLVGLLLAFWSLSCMAAESKPGYHGLVCNQKELKGIAETKGYGYKYGNLQLLDQLTAEFNDIEKPAYSIKVPQFVGIPSEKIQEFLKSDFNIAEKWAAFVKQNLPESKKKEILDTKKFPDNFEEARAAFEKELKEAFDKKIAAELGAFSFKSGFGIEKADELIALMQSQNGKLMVRSTGKEDTIELANAGGNESVANVMPGAKAILEAIKRVVVSYFGAKSLKQRLGVGDKSLFDVTTPPLTPALLQIMIGETNPKDLPKCGVMFTEEAEGALSGLVKGQTSGITLIQCAYGNNEGVVNSRIPVDSYYVDDSLSIYPIIRYKTHRLTPSSDMVANEGAVIKSPALTKDALITLKKFAQALEKFYQGPMDVEFVVKEKNDKQEPTIYIVQARPIVHKTDQALLSYLLNTDKITDKVQGYAIGVAGGAIRTVSSKDEIIMAETLGAALGVYQDTEKTKDTNKVQCIVINTPAPATSHEATTFRSEQKPIVCVDKESLGKIENWVAQEPVQLVISPQQGIVAKWSEETSVTELLAEPNAKAVKGWCNYPCPGLLSLSEAFEPTEDLTEEAVKKLLGEKVELESSEVFKPEDFKTFIKDIKVLDEEQASKKLALLLYQLNKLIMAKVKGLPLDQDDKQRIKTLLHYALMLAQQTKNQLALKPTDASYIKRLFPIRFLEMLLLQQPALDEIVDGNSVMNLIFKVFARWQKVLEEVKDEGGEIDQVTIQMFRAREYIFTDELQEKWKNFVIVLAQSKDEKLKNVFAKFVDQLNKLDLLPVWLNTSFDALMKTKKGVAKSIVMAALNEYGSQKDLLSKLFEMKVKIDAFNIESFADPKMFEKQWNLFTNDLLPYFLNDPFIVAFKKANDLGRLAALGVMDKFVNAFDLSIKAMLGGGAEPEVKVQNLRTMLGQYLELLNKWAVFIPVGSIQYHQEWLLATYMKKISDIYNSMKKNEKNMLLPSGGFSVSAAVLGSATAFDRHYPKSLEDIYTLIHQNLLMIVGVLSNQISWEIKPTLLKEVEDKCLAKFKFKKTSFSCKGTKIYIRYNLPLRNHSAVADVKYNNKTKNLLLTIKFVGARRFRWDFIQWLAYVTQSKINGIHINASKLAEQEVSISYKTISANVDWDSLRQVLQTMISSLEADADRDGVLWLWKDFFKENMDDIKKALKLSLPENGAQLRAFRFLLSDENFNKKAEDTYSLLLKLAMSQAFEGIKNAYDKVNESSFSLLQFLLDDKEALLRKSMNYDSICDAAIKAAEDYMRRDIDMAADVLSDPREAVLKLLNMLVNKRYEKAYGPALYAAKRGFLVPDNGTKYAAENTFESYAKIDKNVAYVSAAEAIEENAKDTIGAPWTKQIALSFCVNIINVAKDLEEKSRDSVYQSVLHTAGYIMNYQMLKTLDSFVFDTFCEIFKKLLETNYKDQAQKEAMRVIDNFSKPEHAEKLSMVMIEVIRLLHILVTTGYKEASSLEKTYYESELTKALADLLSLNYQDRDKAVGKLNLLSGINKSVTYLRTFQVIEEMARDEKFDFSTKKHVLNFCLRIIDGAKDLEEQARNGVYQSALQIAANNIRYVLLKPLDEWLKIDPWKFFRPQLIESSCEIFKKLLETSYKEQANDAAKKAIDDIEQSQTLVGTGAAQYLVDLKSKLLPTEKE